MKLLKVIASGFKNCEDNFEISLVPIARKTSGDKEYELVEIADGLFAFTTIGVVGKNASGKTSALDLVSLAYQVLARLRVERKNYSLNNVKLTIYFFFEGNIYKYDLRMEDNLLTGNVIFRDQSISTKKYYKSKVNSIFSDEGYERISFSGELPEDTSIVFFVTKGISFRSFYYSSLDMGVGAYDLAFSAIKSFSLSDEIFQKIIKVFDENITLLKRIDENNYKLGYADTEVVLSEQELYYRLSSGTTKGIVVYMLVILSLANGYDLIIDEIENHFHKTLVENIISLFKDKSVNKKNATLIFATHYCEILDLFNRQDNIYITKAANKVQIQNMYKDYDVRTELLKSKQFYNNVFRTAVNYEALMDLKRELK